MKNQIKFSVIIPTFDEEENIRSCIQSIRNTNYSAELEIIVADGRSKDKTLVIARDEDTVVCISDPGRGVQCNNGAEYATGEILLFLHADSRLPVNAFEVINKVFLDEKIKISTFRMNFDQDNWILRIYSFFTRFDSIFSTFGDQCIVVRKDFFNKIGKFPSWKLFEDVHFLRLARMQTKIQTLPASVITSARRFKKNGTILQQLRNLWYITQYYLGVSPESLFCQYNKSRKQTIKSGLIIFARYPNEGKVKTRLAKTIGSDLATDFYKICAEYTFSESQKLNNINKYIFCSDNIELDRVRGWVRGNFIFLSQAEGDLGYRIKDSFFKIFEEQTDKVIIIGTDAPDISCEVIEKGFLALDNNDVVIGPTRDGGYYLLGMKKYYSAMFEDIPWSTDMVLHETLNSAAGLALKVFTLPIMYDIDTEKDLFNWSRNNKNSYDNPVFSWYQNKVTNRFSGGES